MRTVIHKAQTQPRRVVFPEGENEKILRAAHILREERIAQPILLGNLEVVRAKATSLGVDLETSEMVDPAARPRRKEHINTLYKLREGRGITLSEAQELINQPEPVLRP
jgi:malate dehydrogenase (oxaloacetate-decarboxylating)(NADP+)